MKKIDVLFQDCQNDFFPPDGALAVPGAYLIRKNLERILRFAYSNGLRVLVSEDMHAEDDPEFRYFPPHCVMGTDGSRLIDEVAMILNVAHVFKSLEPFGDGRALANQPRSDFVPLIEKNGVPEAAGNCTSSEYEDEMAGRSENEMTKTPENDAPKASEKIRSSSFEGETPLGLEYGAPPAFENSEHSAFEDGTPLGSGISVPLASENEMLTESIKEKSLAFEESATLVFEKHVIDIFLERTFASYIDARHPDAVLLCGVATDYCIRASALGLRERGVEVYLLLDAIAAVCEEEGITAMEIMRAAGVQFITTEGLMQSDCLNAKLESLAEGPNCRRLWLPLQ